MQRSIVPISAQSSRLSTAFHYQPLLFKSIEECEHVSMTVAEIFAALLGSGCLQICKPVTSGLGYGIFVCPEYDLGKCSFLHRTQNWNSTRRELIFGWLLIHV